MSTIIKNEHLDIDQDTEADIIVSACLAFEVVAPTQLLREECTSSRLV